MRLGILSLIAALLVFVGVPLTASAGPVGCVGSGTDTDSDGTDDNCDNCSAPTDANPGQEDADLDGHGDFCDCDYNQDSLCDGNDFLIFGACFAAATVPPANPVCDQSTDGLINGNDFLRFGAGLANPGPGPSCGNPLGVPCP